MTVRTAAILFLIALSGCADKVEKNDPPAIGLAAEPATWELSEMPAESTVDSPPATESPNEGESDPPMRNPVQFD
ncbi:hypothetical protein LC608_34995 [Nostoc sp. XA010]|nr:hypothetical protein [Nostoc sp. CHAB 5844]MCC5662030.1 hypothetical protein [Nostoc sp. XA010]